jgi:signal transduction histidine kinase
LGHLDELRSLRERSRLLERLVRIQRSISHRAPLQDVVDAITTGASELLGVGLVTLRLHDDADPGWLRLISSYGLPPAQQAALRRIRIGEGVGGAAYAEQRLVVVDEHGDPDGVPAPGHGGGPAARLHAAMAAPVHRQGRVAGSLALGSQEPGRRFSAEEQDVVLAFAEHASLALTDASTVEELREAQHAKDLFLAMVSHELKTPLTVIMGTLRTLERREALPAEVRTRLLAAAFQRGRDLERLIDRLLQGSRAELAAERHPVALPELVAGAVDGFQATGRLVQGPVADVEVPVDAEAVRRVVGILLENAVAHAPEGTEIAVEAAVAGGQLRIAVRNAGRLPEELDGDALFEPFQRGPGARSSGVGLGLSIAWRLATAAGGRIDVTSGREQVTFTLRLPVEGDACGP